MAVITGMIFLSPAQSSAQDLYAPGSAASRNCLGLHAGIHAEIVGPYTETPSVLLSFTLLNDSENSVEVEASSWKILVNGHELRDMLLGNGPTPTGGYGVLKAGDKYEFGMELPIVKYFLPNGDYKVSWKGAAFQSPTITIPIRPSSH